MRAVPASTALGRSVSLADVLGTHFDAGVNLTIAGQPWHLDARTLLQEAVLTGSCAPNGRVCNQWLSGPLASAWVVGGPVLSPAGIPNPHIAVYFAVRAYGPAPVTRVRVDVIVANDWAYAPDPQGIAYDASINVGGKTVYSINDLMHYRQARWHKVFWWGDALPIYAQQDSGYLQATMAVPRYQDVPPSDAFLASRRQSCEPMQNCDQTSRMGNVGAQPGIGPLPQWAAVYVINPDYRAFNWMLANSDALGSYNVHYRDQLTGQPVSVAAHPCSTLYTAAQFKRCPVAPFANDSFPACKTQCTSPLAPSEAHHPAPAYVAYMVTGDWYYLSELKDWADWVVFKQNPVYRNFATGLVYDTQLRGQAWALRTLGYAAYILPDSDPLKAYFNQVIDNNITWYNQNFTDNPGANKLHINSVGYSVGYPNGGNANTGLPTWQQSMFNWSVGNLNDLGFAGADRLMGWLAPFQVGLMTDPGFCWVVASKYELQVRDTQKSPFYTTLQQVYQKNFPTLRGVECASSAMATALGVKKAGEMSGYPSSPSGYPAMFQIGLAASADAGVPYAKESWELFALRTTQPDYSNQPQWAVIPRYLPAGWGAIPAGGSKPSGGTTSGGSTQPSGGTNPSGGTTSDGSSNPGDNSNSIPGDGSTSVGSTPVGNSNPGGNSNPAGNSNANPGGGSNSVGSTPVGNSNSNGNPNPGGNSNSNAGGVASPVAPKPGTPTSSGVGTPSHAGVNQGGPMLARLGLDREKAYLGRWSLGGVVPFVRFVLGIPSRPAPATVSHGTSIGASVSGLAIAAKPAPEIAEANVRTSTQGDPSTLPRVSHVVPARSAYGSPQSQIR
ncbi:MAG TPA: hypothetical protein VJ833_12180 [Rhodanobacteraceae bacterium]|nr:hypothetical protein [Rhodanobacteraceae bacterium]